MSSMFVKAAKYCVLILLILVFLQILLSKNEQSTLDLSNNATPFIFQIVESQEFRNIAACAEGSSNLACYNRYGTSLIDKVHLIQNTINIERAHQDECLRNLLLNGDNNTFAFDIIVCLINSSFRNENSVTKDFDTNSQIPSIAYAVTILITGYIFLTSEIPNFENEESSDLSLGMKAMKGKDTAKSKIVVLESERLSEIPVQSRISLADELNDEGNNRQLLITLQTQTFDLNTKDGKQRWREEVEQKFNQKMADSNNTNNQHIFSKITFNQEPAKENTLDSLSPTPFAPNQEPKRARTDVNIRNPNKPVPSVLDYPTVDKNGKPLRRIFIPGRGWVSARSLEQEREQLMFAAQLIANQELKY